MATYGAVTFDILVDGPWAPYWSQDQKVEVRHIPSSNQEELQFLGTTGNRLAVTALVRNQADIGTLQSYVGPTPRTLVGVFGQDWPNTYLIAVRNPRRHSFNSTFWLVDLEFYRGA